MGGKVAIADQEAAGHGSEHDRANRLIPPDVADGEGLAAPLVLLVDLVLLLDLSDLLLSDFAFFAVKKGDPAEGSQGLSRFALGDQLEGRLLQVLQQYQQADTVWKDVAEEDSQLPVSD